jgi:isoleucyl-tRNA synthetase
MPFTKEMSMAPVGEIPKDYDAKAVEDQIFKFWESGSIPAKVRTRGGSRKFYFLDGPPYVTNPIHVGTAWNKTLKDVYIRYFRMNGYDVRDQPGFDMHGLPIEVMVEKKIGVKSKKDIEVLGIEKFIEACKAYAMDNLKIATEQFKNLGVWMDWDSPYRTLDNYYIESVWWLIKKAEEKGLLDKGKKIVHWCPRCETVLAGYEATDEYRDVKEDSIYVKFKVKGSEKQFILIWTTTPWTLPANVAVMVNPNFTYARVRAGEETYIMAEGRVESVFRDTNTAYEVVETFPGSDLKNMEYDPPLLEEVPKQGELKPAHFVVLSDQFVTLDEGTGCVHSAPGHGEEDHCVGEAYGLPDFSPVDERGCFTAEGGKYAGTYVRDANASIMEDLKSKGLLFKVEATTHRYPHCWRCKTPLILRIASQWFIKVTDLKGLLLEENEKVTWVPEWAGRARFGNWIGNAKDWVISRQRYWGIPLPIWVCEDCKRYLVVGSLGELKKMATQEVKDIELHRPWVDRIMVKCSCGGTAHRVSDVADVWMDSGAASFATLHYPSDGKAFDYWWPVDLVLEGHDQTRGWFYTLMVEGITVFGTAPYKRVLMHGFTIDQDGRAMHKSLGNVVFPEEVIGKYGRDTLRWYELGCTTWDDLRFSWKALEETSRFVNIMWSTYYFGSLYMSLDRFSTERHPLDSLAGVLRPEDRWILSRFEGLVQRVTEANSALRVFEGIRFMEEFMKEELSRWYIRLIRKRTWSEVEDPDKLAVYATLHHILLGYLKMAAPVMPFATERIFQSMFTGVPGLPESAHMLAWPQPEPTRIDGVLEADMEIAKEVIEVSYAARQSARIKLRQPLTMLRVVSDDEAVRQALQRLKTLVLEQSNVKNLEIITSKEEDSMKDAVLVPDRAVLGPIFREKSGRVADLIGGLKGRQVMEALDRGEEIQLELDGEKISLMRSYFSVKEKLPENFKGLKSRYGSVYIDTTKNKDLISEGLMRDIVRRIQEMRKRANLKVEAYIRVAILAPNQENCDLLRATSKEVAAEVRAKEMSIAISGSVDAKIVEEWEIEEEKFVIGIEEIPSPR